MVFTQTLKQNNDHKKIISEIENHHRIRKIVEDVFWTKKYMW